MRRPPVFRRPAAFVQGTLTLMSCLYAGNAWAAPATTPTLPVTSTAADADAKAGQKCVSSFINAIRFNKDALALKRLDVVGMSQRLLGPTYAEMDANTAKHFADGLTALLVQTSFVRGREMFRYLDALLFDAPKRQGTELHLASTIVVHRELKKVEIPVTWVLHPAGASWQIVDLVAQNESTCAAIRAEEVLPLLQKGGVPKLLEALDARVAETKPKGAK